MNESNEISPDEMTADELFDFYGPEPRVKQLARDAQLASPDLSPDELLDALCAGMKEGNQKLQEHYLQTVEMLFRWEGMVAKAERLYAESLGVESLTDEQKKQALLNHILGEDD